MQPEERAIRELIATWLAASKAHDDATVLGLMAEDVVFLQLGQEPIRGRAAFAKMQQQLAQVDIDARADVQEITVFGEWAYCWNHLSITVKPKTGAAMKRAGNVLTILHKQQGRWVIARDANMLVPVD